jgi:hypothetical protein
MACFDLLSFSEEYNFPAAGPADIEDASQLFEHNSFYCGGFPVSGLEQKLYGADDSVTVGISVEHWSILASIDSSDCSSTSSRDSSPVHPSSTTTREDPDHTQALSFLAASNPPLTQPSEQTPFGQKPKKRQVRNWTDEEHKRFLDAMARFGRPREETVNKDGKMTFGLGRDVAEVIAAAVGTRNPAQVRSHAQKHFQRMVREGLVL